LALAHNLPGATKVAGGVNSSHAGIADTIDTISRVSGTSREGCRFASRCVGVSQRVTLGFNAAKVNDRRPRTTGAASPSGMTISRSAAAGTICVGDATEIIMRGPGRVINIVAKRRVLFQEQLSNSGDLELLGNGSGEVVVVQVSAHQTMIHAWLDQKKESGGLT